MIKKVWISKANKQDATESNKNYNEIFSIQLFQGMSAAIKEYAAK